MRYIVLTLAVALCSISYAQEKAHPAGTVQPGMQKNSSQDEVRAVAGSLKETLGLVQSSMGSVEKQLGVATPEHQQRLGKAQSELKALKEDLEAALTAVSSAKPELWKETKAKAEATNSEAVEAVAKIKKELTTAVN